jgi:hypothetical protein
MAALADGLVVQAANAPPVGVRPVGSPAVRAVSTPEAGVRAEGRPAVETLPADLAQTAGHWAGAARISPVAVERCLVAERVDVRTDRRNARPVDWTHRIDRSTWASRDP